MKQYVLRSLNGDVRKRWVADIFSTDKDTALFYINTPDGPELIAAFKMGVANLIEGEGEYFPAFDKVKVDSSLGDEYITVEDLVSRFNHVRASVAWYQDHYHKKVQEVQELNELLNQHKKQIDAQQKSLHTHARLVQNLSEINKQLEEHLNPQVPGYYDGVNHVQAGGTTSAQVEQQETKAQQGAQTPGAQSRFELENFFENEF